MNGHFIHAGPLKGTGVSIYDIDNVCYDNKVLGFQTFHAYIIMCESTRDVTYNVRCQLTC